MTATTTTITCRGSVRGSCGIHHRTVEAAERCCAADQRACARQGGYSDRYPTVDGEPAPIEDEWGTPGYPNDEVDL